MQTNAKAERSRCCASSSQPMRRRGALMRMAGLMTGLWGGVRTLFGAQRMALSLDKAEKLKTVGNSMLLKIQDKEYLFIRDTKDSVHVLDPICTHKKCTVEYKGQQNLIVCPCHGSNFDLDGNVRNGPAEKPLRTFEASLDMEKGRVIFSLE